MSLFNSTKRSIQGYVYASKEENDLFENAKAGDLIIKKDKIPPYIVVDHSLETKIITQWPGKLFKVEVIDPANEKKLNEGLVKDVWYTRTLGVKILEEVPIAELFGPNGQKIEQIIDLTRTINERQILALSKYDEEPNRALFAKAWRNWIMRYGKKLERSSSPIKAGLSIITSQFDVRARALAGDSAFGIDEDGEIYLQPLWATAVENILHAAMSYAPDDILSEFERKKMRAPFNEVFGLN